MEQAKKRIEKNLARVGLPYKVRKYDDKQVYLCANIKSKETSSYAHESLRLGRKKLERRGGHHKPWDRIRRAIKIMFGCIIVGESLMLYDKKYGEDAAAYGLRLLFFNAFSKSVGVHEFHQHLQRLCARRCCLGLEESVRAVYDPPFARPAHRVHRPIARLRRVVKFAHLHV